MSMKKFHGKVEDLLKKEVGATDVKFVHGGKHVKCYYTYQGKKLIETLSCTPKDEDQAFKCAKSSILKSTVKAG